MYGRIPLTHLRVLEALIRTGRTSLAASELSVTPGAVARQIRALEDLIGEPLFSRTSDGLVPNQRALDLAAETGDALARLQARLEDQPQRRRLRIGVPRAFAALVMAPRLGAFLKDHPDIDLSLDGEAQGLQPSSGRIDLLLRHGLPEVMPKHHGEVLGRSLLFPVAAPALAERIADDPGLFDRLPRLVFQHVDHWAAWLAATGRPSGRVPLMSFSETTMIYAAARAGVGLAIGHSLLAHDDLAAGTLVRVGEAVEDPQVYSLIHHEGADETVLALAAHIRAMTAALA